MSFVESFEVTSLKIGHTDIELAVGGRDSLAGEKFSFRSGIEDASFQKKSLSVATRVLLVDGSRGNVTPEFDEQVDHQAFSADRVLSDSQSVNGTHGDTFFWK